MNFEHPIQPLHDLYARGHVRGLEGDIRNPLDLHARRDFDEQGRLLLPGQEPGRDGPQERGKLRLQTIQKDVSS